MCGVVKYVVSKEVEVSVAFLVLFLLSGDLTSKPDMLSVILKIIDEEGLSEPKVKIKLCIAIFDEGNDSSYEAEMDWTEQSTFSANTLCLVVKVATKMHWFESTYSKVGSTLEYLMEHGFLNCATLCPMVFQMIQLPSSCYKSVVEPITVLVKACLSGLMKLYWHFDKLQKVVYFLDHYGLNIYEEYTVTATTGYTAHEDMPHILKSIVIQGAISYVASTVNPLTCFHSYICSCVDDSILNIESKQNERRIMKLFIYPLYKSLWDFLTKISDIGNKTAYVCVVLSDIQRYLGEHSSKLLLNVKLGLVSQSISFLCVQENLRIGCLKLGEVLRNFRNLHLKYSIPYNCKVKTVELLEYFIESAEKSKANFFITTAITSMLFRYMFYFVREQIIPCNQLWQLIRRDTSFSINDFERKLKILSPQNKINVSSKNCDKRDCLKERLKCYLNVTDFKSKLGSKQNTADASFKFDIIKLFKPLAFKFVNFILILLFLMLVGSHIMNCTGTLDVNVNVRLQYNTVETLSNFSINCLLLKLNSLICDNLFEKCCLTQANSCFSYRTLQIALGYNNKTGLNHGFKLLDTRSSTFCDVNIGAFNYEPHDERYHQCCLSSECKNTYCEADFYAKGPYVFSSKNKPSNNIRKSYFLSLGEAHRPVFSLAYPVFKSSLDRHFESSLDTSSINSSLEIELLRVGTFWNFPGRNTPSSLALAKAGFFYTGDANTVECFHCHVQYCDWNSNDDPFAVHRRISPSCGFINGQTNSNVPVTRHDDNTGAVGGHSLSDNVNQAPTQQNAQPYMSSGSNYVHNSNPEVNNRAEAVNRSSANLRPHSQQENDQSRFQENYNQNESNNLLQQYSSAQRANSDISTTNTHNNLPPNNAILRQNLQQSPRAHAASGQNSQSNHSNAQRTNQHTQQHHEWIQRPMDISPNQTNNSSTEIRNQPLQLEPLGIVTASPRYPAYAILSIRMSTYQGWPSTSGQTPRQMAIAGFIFAGYSDYTRCFFCGGGLRNWEPEDDPWIEHAKWFPKCVYVRQNKGDSFVQLVHQSLNNPDILQANEVNGTINEHRQAVTSPNTALQSNDPAVKSVMEMGCSRQVIDAAIAILRNEQRNVDAYNIMDTILSNDIENSLPTAENQSGLHPARNCDLSTIRAEHRPEVQNPMPNRLETSVSQHDPAIKSVEEMGYSRQVIDAAITILMKGNKDVSAYNIMDIILSHDLETSASLSSSGEIQNSGISHEKENTNAERPSGSQAAKNEMESASTRMQGISITDIKSLVEENKSLKESRLCKICLDNEASIAFVPCGHLVCCGECAFALKKCPICREFINGRVKTWMA